MHIELVSSCCLQIITVIIITSVPVSFPVVRLVVLECPFSLKALTDTLNGEHTVSSNKFPSAVQFADADIFFNSLCSPVISEIDTSYCRTGNIGGDFDSKQILSFPDMIKIGSPGSSEIINNINHIYFLLIILYQHRSCMKQHIDDIWTDIVHFLLLTCTDMRSGPDTSGCTFHS